MPKGKRRQRRFSWDGEASDAEGSYMNGMGSNNAGAINEHERNSGDSHTTANQVDDGRPEETRVRRDSHGSRFGPWTHAIQDVVQSMGITHRAIKNLEDKFKSHVDDLLDNDETRNMLITLKEECSAKDEQIKRREDTIAILRGMDTEAKAEIDQSWAEIKKAREKLNEEEIKQEKRVAAIIAEDTHKLRKEFEKLTKDYHGSYMERRKELEDEGSLIKEEQKRLTATVEAQEKDLEAQSKKLNVALEECDRWKRITDSYRQEKQSLERELRLIKDGLALESKPREYFKQAFSDIYSSIERVSFSYFHDISGKDLENIEEVLAEADTYFNSVPIDDTTDSHDLLAAHAQRIITNAICDFIWKPLRSEFTLVHPEVNSMLNKLSDQLRNTTPGGRSANIWVALTMRALACFPLSENAESQNIPSKGSSARADSVVSKVMSVLSPLVNNSQVKALREELDNITHAAINVWDCAQKSGELQITVIQSLERTHREEWRHHQFDPVALSSGPGEADIDTISKTRPRIITLFPRVVAWTVVDLPNDEKRPPGSFPREPDHASHHIETCIHTGKGLPESSPLVVRGKEHREEQKELFIKAMKDAKKDAHRRASENRRELPIQK